MRDIKTVLTVAAGSLALLLGSAARAGDSNGPVNYVEQSRSVSASSSADASVRGGTSAWNLVDQQGQTQQAGNLGAFGGNVAAASQAGASTASAAAAQQSSLNANRLSASGFVQAGSLLGGDGSGNAAARSQFQVSFDVSRAMSYVFSADVSGGSGGADAGNPSATITLSSQAGVSLIALAQAINLTGYQTGGTLSPGEYSLTLDTQAGSVDGVSDAVNYAVSMSMAAIPAGVSTDPAGPSASPAVVPLPTALASAAVMLAGLGATGFVRRRWSRWVQAALA